VFILGASAVNAPVFGGTLVPSLDVTLVAAFDAQGQWSLGLPWPAGVATGAKASAGGRPCGGLGDMAMAASTTSNR
jgi:hypothetical protein